MYNLFEKNHQYLNCPHIRETLHFFYNGIRSCCANAPGINFYPEYNGEKVDWDYVYNKRKSLIEKINNSIDNFIPDECQNCFEIKNHLSDKKIENFDNKIYKVIIQNNITCNAKCTYCSFKEIMGKGYRYDVLPVIKDLISQNILSKDAIAYISGGEMTISPEFEELLYFLLEYLKSNVEILTNSIKYSEAIKQAFMVDRCKMLVSLDSGTAQTYKAIKQVDCFNNVVNNLREYIKASDNARYNITLKYILVDGINDNKDEISAFINLSKNIGIKKVRVDVDFIKYTLNDIKKIPKNYNSLIRYFNEYAHHSGLEVISDVQIEEILKRN